MNRSQVNDILGAAEAFVAGHGVALPPFARWSPDDFRARRAEAGRVIDARLGWDVTDYGLGAFEATGLVLFTLRNGSLAELRAGGGMVYAEKVLIARVGQLSPMHTHVRKTEDIINRAGGTLAVHLCGSDGEGACAPDRGVRVACDGIARDIAANGVLRLAPGESVTLRPGDWHAFWAEGADVLIGEVSTVNDDETDNVFREALGRFSDIEEDAAPHRLLVSDYAQWLGAP